ncbi:MAG: hypothetical protein GY870_05270 [archaeon]|nr:hypothetical protein [archaeon]
MDEREPIYSYFHFTILNSEYKEGVITKWGQDIIISSEVLDTYFLKSFGGHLHNPQQIGNCYYAGSIMPVERREKQKSFIVHDREAKTVERIEINHRDIIDLPIDAGVLLKKENYKDYLQNYNKKDIIRINIYGNSSDISKLNINKIKDFYKDSHWLRVFINPDKAEESKTKIDSNILELNDRDILKKYFKESNEKNIKKILSVYDKTIL